MIKFRRKTDYAIRALLEIAARHPELIKINDIVSEQNMPPDYVAAVLGELSRGGVVTSRRGPYGGYALARSPSAITLDDIVTAIDGLVFEFSPPVPAMGDGVARQLPEVWYAMGASIRRTLREITLAQLLAGEVEFTGALLAAD